MLKYVLPCIIVTLWKIIHLFICKSFSLNMHFFSLFLYQYVLLSVSFQALQLYCDTMLDAFARQHRTSGNCCSLFENSAVDMFPNVILSKCKRFPDAPISLLPEERVQLQCMLALTV